MSRASRLLLLTAVLFASSSPTRAARYWVARGSSNWNNTANWSTTSGGRGGASVPGPTDVVTFDFNGEGNCTIDVSVSIQQLTVSLGYFGTITQGAYAVSIAGTTAIAGGTFAGGSGDITVGSTFTLSGGTFTSTSAVLELDGNSAFTGGTFNNNNGTVLYVATGGNTTISGTSPAFYVLEFAGEGYTYNITSTGAIMVTGSLNFIGSQAYTLNTGTINVSGNIDVTNTAAGCKGSALITIDGTGTQLITGSPVAGAGALPQVTINKAAGILSLANYPASSNNFTYTAGTINAGTSTWCFTNGSSSPYTIKGTLTLNNITFLATASVTFTIPVNTTLTASGDLTIAGTGGITLNTGNIDVHGNLYLTNSATTGGGSALITIDGTGSQAVDGTAISIGQDLLPAVTIDKTGGTLDLKGNISESGNWIFTAGAVDASTFSSTVAFGGKSLTVTSAGMSFYNVSVTGNTTTLASSLTAGGNLTITGGALTPGTNTINLAGSWSDYGTAGFTEATSTVILNGSALQTITTPGGETFATLTIDNSGPGVKLFNSTTAGTDLTMSSGNIDLNGNILTIGLSVANNGTLVHSGGTIINTGTVTRWFKAAAIAGSTGLFPVGTASNYRPFLVTTTANPTAGGTISVFYTDASTNSAVMFPDGAATVYIRKDLNWAVSEGNGLTGGTYSLQIQGTGFGQVGSVSDLRMTLADAVVGTPGTNGGTITDPQVNRTGLTRANLNNTFYIGSVNPEFTTLPLDLLYFNGRMDNGQVLLDWATPADDAVAFFIVQRSGNGTDWKDWERLQADSTGGATDIYHAIDHAPLPGTSFYRLQLAGDNGNALYSSVLAFTQDAASGGVTLYPVPATGYLTVSFAKPGNYLVQLLNILGQPVRETLNSSGDNIGWQVSGLAAGAYFVRIIQDGTIETRTVLIK